MSIEELEKHKFEILDNLMVEEQIHIQEQKGLHGIILSLASQDLIKYEIKISTVIFLTEEGENVIDKGSPEKILFDQMIDGQAVIKDISLNYAIQNKWIRIENKKMYKNKVDSIDETRNLLLRIKEKSKLILQEIQKEWEEKEGLFSQNEFKMLKKRKLIQQKDVKTYLIQKGSKFSMQKQKFVSELTSSMVSSNEYKNVQFKDYNFKTSIRCSFGSLHPLRKVKSEMKKIFLELGFTEMPTSRYVESSFWNFDALFQPQNHSSREMHDTFFLSYPQYTDMTPTNLTEKVKKVHESAYKYEWSNKEALKNILRTHTTSCSMRMLYDMTKNGKELIPCKLFSIDRVFRNESVDATHLAEFHQIEGLVMGKNLSIGHLMGVLKEFFFKLGLKDIKFKPTFNPYTEPSLEIFSYHKSLQKWIEVGNSGIFRPEVLEPLNIKGEWKVIAWGLSLERPAMIKYGLKNIRELIGFKSDLEFIKNSEVCFFE